MRGKVAGSFWLSSVIVEALSWRWFVCLVWFVNVFVVFGLPFAFVVFDCLVNVLRLTRRKFLKK